MEIIRMGSFILGVTLLLAETIVSAYFLLLRKVEVKRVVIFATILIFCGSFLVLYKRITLLEFAGLGKIKVQAIEDAEAIRRIRDDVEAQSKTIQDVVVDAQKLRTNISSLTITMEKEKIQHEKKNIEQRILSLTDDINTLSVKIRWLQLDSIGASLEEKDRMSYWVRISRLAAQMKKFARQRDDLEKQLERESHIAPIKIQEEK
jgi:ethanolamine utilization protein EutA (predicted chaperonin)